ncbi:hypothetical protein L2E82_32575 [Cichorium intybus]|uniref:Uncharacterized protein n=1 Tax=Cichorium intybus TaxID=13427 RepID=A0ACB9BG93_CICIN|nr:hypothetical protein L2E82_32575 [Cichorium intybus]
MLTFVWLVRFSSNLDHRLVMVWDKMVVVHAKARNNRDLNAASIQISRESLIDKNGVVSQSIFMVRQDQIRRESIIDKNGAIRLLTELCSSYRLLYVPAGGGGSSDGGDSGLKVVEGGSDGGDRGLKVVDVTPRSLAELIKA